MKKILLFALPLLALLCTSCRKEEEVWTDDSPIIEFTNLEFLSYLLKTEWRDERSNDYPIDRNGDGRISEKEASVVTYLFIGVGVKLTAIEGIKYFTALKDLSCYYNQLTSLDLSNNTALTCLGCFGNQLTSLDLSNNTALTWLGCGENQLTALDISKNTALTYLECEKNQLTALDISKNTALTYLRCSNNQLTTLDVSKNTALETLYVDKNPLEKIRINVKNKLPQEFINEYKDIIEYVTD